MKTISLLILAACLTLAVAPAFGEDATQTQLDTLSGKIQDLTATIETQNKKIEALESEIKELREKVNTPAPIADTAKNEDLKNLAEKVKEVDQKRQADRDLILKAIADLAKANGGSGTARVHPVPNPGNPGGGDTGGTGPATPQSGHPYVIKSNDTVAAIAKAYRAAGVKVTTKQILDANPGLDPNKLTVGKTIFIPDPNAK